MLDVAPDAEAEIFSLDIEGYEGPLDLLLSMAQSQKVDLMQISILQLAEQYLAFVEHARTLRLELAADYLVAAAWLAYLKSRLLLPPEEKPEDEMDAAALEAALRHRLARLEAMRKAAARLMGRDRLGRDRFVRGLPDPIAVERHTKWKASLLDLLQAYARCQSRAAYTPLHVKRPKIYAMEDALARLKTSLGIAVDWTVLEAFLPDDWMEPALRRSAVASTFAASLELARDGLASLEQTESFGPIRIRAGDIRAQSA